MTLINETPAEKAKRIGVPLIKGYTPKPHTPRDVIAVCGECGLSIPTAPFGYCCPRSNCPCGFGSPYSLAQMKPIDGLTWVNPAPHAAAPATNMNTRTVMIGYGM